MEDFKGFLQKWTESHSNGWYTEKSLWECIIQFVTYALEFIGLVGICIIIILGIVWACKSIIINIIA